MQDEIIYLDQEGYEAHLKAIENLNISLGRVYERINMLREKDFNLDTFNELEELKNNIKKRIYEMKDKTNRIKIISKEEDNTEIIDINDTFKCITYFDVDDFEENEYTLVGGESDFINNKVSVNSPLGKVVYRAKVGSDVYYKINSGNIRVTILEKINEKKLVKENK